jgi:hypothetical protein
MEQNSTAVNTTSDKIDVRNEIAMLAGMPKVGAPPKEDRTQVRTGRITVVTTEEEKTRIAELSALAGAESISRYMVECSLGERIPPAKPAKKKKR